MNGKLNLAERALTKRLDDVILPQASFGVPGFETAILTRIWVLAVVVMVAVVMRAVRLGGRGLRVLLLLVGGRRSTVRIGTLLATISWNGELALGVGLWHGGESFRG